MVPDFPDCRSKHPSSEICMTSPSRIPTEFSEGTPHRIRAFKDLPPVPPAYPHQLDALNALEVGNLGRNPPVSGIIHLPTGAGKTRIGLEYIARSLKENPAQQFIWATDGRGLIQQSMRKALEYAELFPDRVRMVWHDGTPDLLLGDDYQLVFITRRRLTAELTLMQDQRRWHLWREQIESRESLTLIYDECHQLGAEQLQEAWWKLHEKVFSSGRVRSHKWRVIGLSATPLPTSSKSHELLKEVVFPLRKDAFSVDQGWGLHIFHRVSNQELLRQGVLCPVNMDIDAQGEFDVPERLLARILSEKRLTPPDQTASPADLYRYSKKFNREVMGHIDVLEFFAKRLSQYITILGKTIVFVPDIESANKLVGFLSKYQSLNGKVALVHSKLDEFESVLPSQTERTPEQVLAAFSARKDEPCILVNVEMLTEGYDDPKVQTVLLGKLTLSTNRFWQMIGRGTRGPRSGGTQWCNVIDPIKLVRLYDYTAGYQPTVYSRDTVIAEDESSEVGQGQLDPWVDFIRCPPLPSKASYKVDPVVRSQMEEVAKTIDQFLAGLATTNEAIVRMAENTRIDYENGSPVLRLGEDREHGVGEMVLREFTERLKKQLEAELAWLEVRLPKGPESDALKEWLRRLDAIRSLKLRTDHEYQAAEREGRLETVTVPDQSMTATAAPSRGSGESTKVADLARVCAVLARIDGDLDPREVAAAAALLVEHCGVADTVELRKSIEDSSIGDAAGLLRRTVGTSDLTVKRTVMKGLVRVAVADQRIHEAERDLLISWAAVIDMPHEYVEGLLDR